MKIKCFDPKREDEWEIVITRMISFGSHYEISISGPIDVEMHVGKTCRGGFVCIADFRISSLIIRLTNRHWNSEKLIEAFGVIRGISVAEALYALGKEGMIADDFTEPSCGNHVRYCRFGNCEIAAQYHQTTGHHKNG